ncbi:MAG: HAMP domain-containing histidine kinase [Deltaproteobacteria bacterium]|nr:HAMP domain-containing histidine kinase [Deltaproteobacteria bacterium]
MLVAIALVVLTRTGERAADSIGTSVEGVRLAEEAQIDLLMHSRARNTVLGHDIEGELRRRLGAAREHVSGRKETQLLATAASDVDAYFSAARDPAIGPDRLESLHAAAYAALDSLATLNVAQARASQEEATDGRRLGNILGITVGVLMIGGVGVVILWLRRRAFRPIFVLAETMTRFGRGDRSVRAALTGPAELREMSKHFNEVADALEQQRQSQIALLGGVAHDLRGPLGALQLSIEMIGTDASAPQRRLVDTASRQIARLERLVNDFLNLAKLDAGELALDMIVEDARKLVNDAVDLLLTAQSARDRIAIRLPAEAVHVRCDPLRVEQVVSNLVSNAIKYSPAQAPVELELSTANHEAVLRVIDHGVGISEDDRRVLFQPFRRVGRSKDAAPGVGLGLWVARRIVDAHGGKIEVASTPGGGSTFTVHLPLFDGASTDLGPRERTPSVTLH